MAFEFLHSDRAKQLNRIADELNIQRPFTIEEDSMVRVREDARLLRDLFDKVEDIAREHGPVQARATTGQQSLGLSV